MKRSKRNARKPVAELSQAGHPPAKPATPILTPEFRKHALLLAALIAIAFCVYSNAFQAPFLLDNDQAILQDPRIRTATSNHLFLILNEPYRAGSGLYRPLTTLSLMYNFVVLGNGVNPAGYHWFNLLLHALNIVLVYVLGVAVLEQPLAALLLAALWSLHPIQTEAVANIVGRADMLAAFGVLAALLAHRYALRATGLRKAAFLAAMAIAMTAGIFSKESAIVALAVIPLYDFTFARTASWRSRIPNYIALAVPCLVFLLMRSQVLANAPAEPFPFVDNPLTGAGFWAARLTAVKIIGKYLLLLAWPARLSYDYSYNQIPVFNWNLGEWESWKAVVALLACSAAALLAVRSYRRHKPIFFFIVFFAIVIAPVSNLVLIVGTVMGERLMYLPSLAFLACAAYAISAMARRLPRTPSGRYAGISAVAVILIALSARTYARNGDWSNPEKFWNSGVYAAPNSFRTNLSSANAAFLSPQGNWPHIIAQADRALAILNPLPPLKNVGFPYRDAAIMYRTLGDASSGNPESNPVVGTTAAYWYTKSLSALLRSQKIELARQEQSRLLNAGGGKSGYVPIPSALYLQMGLTYMRLNDPPHALDAFERGRVLDPNPDLLEQLADAYSKAGDPRKAAATLVEAIALDPSRGTLTPKLLALYAQIDPRGCAASHDRGDVSLNLNCPVVHSDICAASKNIIASFARAGQNFELEAIRNTAIQDLGCAPELLK